MKTDAGETLHRKMATNFATSDAEADLRYSLGFLVGRKLDWVPAHFVPVSFACPLHVHPNASVAVSRSEDNDVAIVGEAIHPDHPEMSQNDVAALLLRRTSDRQAEIDKLVGRFVVIDCDRLQGLAIQSDAIGMRSVFFGQHDGGSIAASTAKLASRACGAQGVRATDVPFKLGYPGLRTPYVGVFRLPPNSSLDLDSGAVRRFFPLQPIEPCTIEEGWDFALSQARQVVSGALKRRPVVMSLTAGLDSRTTLAATRGLWPNLTFFTYRSGRSRSHTVDAFVASRIAQLLRLRHHVVNFYQLAPDPALMQAIEHNTFGEHAHLLACAYHRDFGSHKFLHFRTNLLEVTRSNLYCYNDSKPEFSGGPATAEQMARFYAVAGRIPFTDRQVAAFAEYRALTNFDQALSFASAWDLYFVEHRMGAWHAGVVAESDIAFETLIAFNSRNIIRRFMGVPQQVRSNSDFIRSLLRRLLPEIARVPINPRNYPGRLSSLYSQALP